MNEIPQFVYILLYDLRETNRRDLKFGSGEPFDQWPDPMSNWWASLPETTPEHVGYWVFPHPWGGTFFTAKQFSIIPYLVGEGYLRAVAQETRFKINGGDEMTFGTHRYFVTEKGIELIEPKKETQNDKPV
jgi:hypothetical protein